MEVDDAVGEHVAHCPVFPGHCEGAGGARVVRAGHGVGELVRGQRLVEPARAEREADHGAEVADALAQVDNLVRVASGALGGVSQGLALGPGVLDGVRIGVDAAGVTAREFQA
ncbi:hypothetical protein [Streptomyces afghaniensis]|uniref:hypothetical protein n=1 Tax=Streptomyces afghaniensis TaxID=66865 RepID=UPI00246844CA|nr:hypothetical protein [Streptomyces afghaniensis]